MRRFLHRIAHFLAINRGENAIYWDDDTHTTMSITFCCYACGDLARPRRYLPPAEWRPINHHWEHKHWGDHDVSSEAHDRGN